MGFRLIPNSVILDDTERRNIHLRSVISPNSVAFGADYVKVIIIIIIIKCFWWRASMSSCERRIVGAGGHVEDYWNASE